ncbi:unnamed protein product, partial [Hapterophycus canaliculatus]
GVDERTDIYSLGCLLVFLLTGRPPYVGDTAMDTLLQHTSPEPIDLKSCFRQLSIPPSLTDLIESMLEKKVERRPASMLQVRDELIRIREQATKAHEPGRRTQSLKTIGFTIAA